MMTKTNDDETRTNSLNKKEKWRQTHKTIKLVNIVVSHEMDYLWAKENRRPRRQSTDDRLCNE